MASPWTEAQVRELLAELKNLPQASTGYLLGAQAGLLLRRLHPEFRADVLGDQRLADLLQKFPDIVTVEHDPNHDDILVIFRDSSLVPSVEPAAMWQALVAPRRQDKWYLDLATGEPTRVPVDEHGLPAAGTGPAEEDHRYLEIPRVDQEVLRVRLRDWVNQSGADLEVRERLLAILGREDWYLSFKEACEASNQRGWSTLHRTVVVEHLEAWARAHGIKPARYLRSQRPRPPTTPSLSSPNNRPSLPRTRRSDVRQIVERAIARMSDEELLELRIPLRYILD
jgi:hypothetical protein